MVTGKQTSDCQGPGVGRSAQGVLGGMEMLPSDCGAGYMRVNVCQNPLSSTHSQQVYKYAS